MNLILHDFYLVVDAKGFPFIPTKSDILASLESRFQQPDFDFLDYLSRFLKKPWKFYTFDDLLELECVFLRLKLSIYQQIADLRRISLEFLHENQATIEKTLTLLFRSLRNVLEQCIFLDLKINVDFLLIPPKNQGVSLITPLIFSDNGELLYELLMTLVCLNNLSEGLKTFPAKTKTLLCFLFSAYLLACGLPNKFPLNSLLNGERTEEDREKLSRICEERGLQLQDFEETRSSCAALLVTKGSFSRNEEEIKAEDANVLVFLRFVRKFAEHSQRILLGLHTILVAELLFNGVKTTAGEGLENFVHRVKEEKRTVLSHVFEQMSRTSCYNTRNSPDLSGFVYETLQLSGFSYENWLLKARNLGETRENPRNPSECLENFEVEGALARKWLEYSRKSADFSENAYFSNKNNLVLFIKLADKIRFSYENLEAQLKGLDSRGNLLTFIEEEKAILDETIEKLAMKVLENGNFFENIEVLAPIVVYFKTVYNQEESRLFSLLFEILKELITSSLENSAKIAEIQRKHGHNLIEECILQLLQLFFVFEIRNETTEKLNKSLLSLDFFEKLRENLELCHEKNLDTAHFVFNQVLFHSLTNDNNIIRDFLLNLLENPRVFELFARLFRAFFNENKVIFLCNFNLLRRKVLQICERADNRFENLEKCAKSLEIATLYCEIFTRCFLLWADTSSLDNDFLEIKCIKSLYEAAFVRILEELRNLFEEDWQTLKKLKETPIGKQFLLVFCDSLAKKYRLIQENLLYFMKTFAQKLCDNEVSQLLLENFLQTLLKTSHPLAKPEKDESSWGFADLQSSRLILDSAILRPLLDFLRNAQLFPRNGLFLCSAPLKIHRKLLKTQDLDACLREKRLEIALSFFVEFVRKTEEPRLLEKPEETVKIREICELLLFELKSVRNAFFSRISLVFQRELAENALLLEHYCSLHPQNDFSRKLLHQDPLWRQITKFLWEIARNFPQSELREAVIHKLLAISLQDLRDLRMNSRENSQKTLFLLKSAFLLDEIRKLATSVHESKTPSKFLSEAFLREISRIFKELAANNQEMGIAHDIKGQEVLIKLNLYVFYKLTLNFLLDFLIKTLLFNEFSLLLDQDFHFYLKLVMEEVFPAIFLYWRGFFKQNEEIPLKMLKIVEALSLQQQKFKEIPGSKAKKRQPRVFFLQQHVLKLFLRSTYAFSLRIRSIYLYKLVHFSLLTTPNPENLAFELRKFQFVRFFANLLRAHIQAISPSATLNSSKSLQEVLETPHFSEKVAKSAGFLEELAQLADISLINRMDVIESACIQAMLSNLVARLLVSSENWDCEPALEPGLRLIYWSWEGCKEFVTYTSRLLSRISEEKLKLSEEELDTLHNDTIGNLVEMLKDNLPAKTAKNQTNARKLARKTEKFMELCCDFLEKYLKQQEIQLDGGCLNMVRAEILRDSLGMLASSFELLGFLGVSLSGGSKARVSQIFQRSLLDARVFKESGFQEKFCNEMLIFVEKLLVESFEDLGIVSLEIAIKGAFFEETRHGFRESLSVKEMMSKETLERCFSLNPRAFVDSLYKLCWFFTATEGKKQQTLKNFEDFQEKREENRENCENIQESSENLTESRQSTTGFPGGHAGLTKGAQGFFKEEEEEEEEETRISLRKGLISTELQSVEPEHVGFLSKKSEFCREIFEKLLTHAISILFERCQEKTTMKLLDLDFTMKLLVILMGKYPILMGLALDFSMKLPQNLEFSRAQAERLRYFARNQQFSSNLADFPLSFLEICLLMFDESPFVLRQMLILFVSQDFRHISQGDRQFSSGEVVRNWVFAVLEAELLDFSRRKRERLLGNSDDCAFLKNSLGLYAKLLAVWLRKVAIKGENLEISKKFREFLDILLQILKNCEHELDLIALRELNFFGFLCFAYKSLIKLAFFKETGLIYSKHSEYLKFYLNKHLKTWTFQARTPQKCEISAKTPAFSLKILREAARTSRKLDWLPEKSKEIQEYTRNISDFTVNSATFPRHLLETREDLRHFAGNYLDTNLCESLKALTKAGIIGETGVSRDFKETHDYSSLKYVSWPTSAGPWLEKLQKMQENTGNSKIFLSFDTMFREVSALALDIKEALRNEVLRYAAQAPNREDSELLRAELLTQSCLTVFGSEDFVYPAGYYEKPAIFQEFWKRTNSLSLLENDQSRENLQEQPDFYQEMSENTEELHENSQNSAENEESSEEGRSYFETFQGNQEKLTENSRNSSGFEDFSEESKETPRETANTPTFLEKFGLEPGFLQGFSEEMQGELLEPASLSKDSTKLAETSKKLRLLALRERKALGSAPRFLQHMPENSRKFTNCATFQRERGGSQDETLEFEQLLRSLPFSAKKRVLLQADASFFKELPEDLRREAEELRREAENSEDSEFLSSDREDDTWEDANFSESGEEEEKKPENLLINNECVSLKVLDFARERGENASESASDEKLLEKTSSFIGDELKKPQNSLMKRLLAEKGEKPRVRGKKRANFRRNSEKFLFKNYKKIKEIDESLDKIGFFLDLPELDDETLAKLFELLRFSLLLGENSNVASFSLRSVFRFAKLLLLNPRNAYRFLDGLFFLINQQSQHNFLENTHFFGFGYGLLGNFPTIRKKELVCSGFLNVLFVFANKLVEKHYCLPLFLQGIIAKDRSLQLMDATFPGFREDFSIDLVKTLRNRAKLAKVHASLLEKTSGNCAKPQQSAETSQLPQTLTSLLISSLKTYEKCGYSYLNGETLLCLIKNLLKLSVIDDGLLTSARVRYPQYKLPLTSASFSDLHSLCEIFYQKRLRLKYFETPYYELFIELARSPLNFERLFSEILCSYTAPLCDFLEKVQRNAAFFFENQQISLKNFWENVLVSAHSRQNLAEDLHFFRHVVKDLVLVAEIPLKTLYKETIYKDFQKKFGLSVKEIDTEACEDRQYLREWLHTQKNRKKTVFLQHLKEKVLRNASLLRFFQLLIEILAMMIEKFGVEFEDFSRFEKERLEDCYYFFIYPVKSLLILYAFLAGGCEEDCASPDYIGISDIKTKELLKSEREFASCCSNSEKDFIHENRQGFLALELECLSPVVFPLEKSEIRESFNENHCRNSCETLDSLYTNLLKPSFLKLITFFMQSKGENESLSNYLDYIRRAKRKSSLSLDVKFGYLRSYSREKALSRKGSSRFLDDPLTFLINRQNLWTSTLDTLLQVSSEELALRPLKIVFEGEEGIDYGGVTREWLSLLNREVFDPQYGLFKLSANNVSYQPNPLACVIPDSLTQFRELGRLLGKILLDNLNIEINFVQSFLKHLLGKTLYIRDLSSIDPDLCKNLEWILENDVSDLDLNFAYDFDFFERPLTIELVEDGLNVRVAEHNKKEYVKLMCYAKMACEIKPQTEAFLKGFLTIIPREALSLVDDKELGMKLCGTSEIDVEDMKNHTDFLSYSQESPVIQWLWEILRNFDQETLAKFLFFVTGSFKVPFGGFKNFRLKIEKLYDGNALPTAHTCFNQLDLPEYESKEKMREKLLVAILEGNKGFYIC